MDDKRVPAHLSFVLQIVVLPLLFPENHAVASLQERWILLLGLLLS